MAIRMGSGVFWLASAAAVVGMTGDPGTLPQAAAGSATPATTATHAVRVPHQHAGRSCRP